MPRYLEETFLPRNLVVTLFFLDLFFFLYALFSGLGFSLLSSESESAFSLSYFLADFALCSALQSSRYSFTAFAHMLFSFFACLLNSFPSFIRCSFSHSHDSFNCSRSFLHLQSASCFVSFSWRSFFESVTVCSYFAFLASSLSFFSSSLVFLPKAYYTLFNMSASLVLTYSDETGLPCALLII